MTSGLSAFRWGTQVNILLDGIELLIHFRREIAEYTHKIRHRIVYGKEKIIVLGAGGVGKTTLGQILSGVTHLPGEEYKDSINTESFSYDGRIFGSILVGPGQKRRREEHWPSLRQQISKGKAAGIIFVTAAGYNALREIEPEEHELFEPGMALDVFLKKYCDANLQNDTQIIREELTQCLSDAPGRIWFLTVILKKDLWWPYEKKIIKNYQTGPYGDALSKIAHNRGQKEFVHEYIPASLLIENLVSRRGVMLAKTAAGFDSAKQLESLRDLSRAISELIIDKEFQDS